MKLSTKKINIADYSKDNKADIANLARSLNPLMDDLERIFRNNLSVEDNLPFQYVTFTTEVDSTSSPKNTIKLTTNLTTAIRGCLVVNATNPTTYPNAALGAVVDVNTNVITIRKIFGIPQNTPFEITLMVVSN